MPSQYSRGDVSLSFSSQDEGENNNGLADIGLGYVGLPLAVAFSQRRPVVGYESNPKRLKSLLEGQDLTGEVSECE